MPATYSDGLGRHGVTSVELLDAGPFGCGARSASFIEPGMTVALRPAGSPFALLSAVVVRCEADGESFRLGLAFPRSTAA